MRKRALDIDKLALLRNIGKFIDLKTPRFLGVLLCYLIVFKWYVK